VADDAKKPKSDKHEGPAHASPYGLSTLAPAIRLVDVAAEIAEADQMIGAVASSKLETIAKQIRALQDEARRVLEKTKQSLDLHRAECRFTRRPGHVYHLYRKERGLSWSMIGPDEWRGEPPHEYVGSYRLEADQSWTPVGEEEERDEALSSEAILGHLLGEGR
jgi:hypothetical protein